MKQKAGLTPSKTLYIVRHAKSSWNELGLADIDRPLNARGKQNAPQMGKLLAEKGILPDLIISSPAKRAYKTAKKISKEIQYPDCEIKLDKKLYHADTDEILEVLWEVDDNVNNLMIFGHNPGLTDLTNYLSGEYIDNVPTCGVVAIKFGVRSWTDIGVQNSELLFFEYPKKED